MDIATFDEIDTGILAPRLSVLGAIKIGGKKPETRTSEAGNDFQPPVKYDHFKIRTRDRGPDGNLLLDEAVHEVVGPQPTELDVRLPFDEMVHNFAARMTQYSGQTCVRKCNGVEQEDPRTAVRKPCDRRGGRDCACKPYARLNVMLEAAPTFGGIYVYRTTSWESASALQTTLQMFEKQFGSLRGLPLRLVLYRAEVKYTQGGKQRTGTAHKVGLVLRASFEEARQATLEFHRQNRIAKREILQIAAGTTAALDELDRQEEGEIGAEFFPAGSRGQADTRPASRSKLADVNEAILGGPGAEAPEAPEEGPEDDLVRHLRSLMEAAGDRLANDHRTRLNRVLESRDPDNLRIAVDWLSPQVES